MGYGEKLGAEAEADQATLTVSLRATQEASLQRLRLALKAAEGLWKNRDDLPKDGLQYQRQLRDEWP